MQSRWRDKLYMFNIIAVMGELSFSSHSNCDRESSHTYRGVLCSHCAFIHLVRISNIFVLTF